MATRPTSEEPLRVGSILEETRKRQEVKLETVEERTKIRTKYLRALENEDWDVLPGPAYTRGFIRAYADLLGLDGEVLVDEYRRRHEEPSTSTYELAEPVLTERRRLDARAARTPARLIAGGLLAAIVLALMVVGLVTGDDEGEGGGGKPDRQARARDAGPGAGSVSAAPGAPGQVTVKLDVRSDLQACVRDDQGRVLVSNQLLSAGAEDGPYAGKRFRIELDPAAARLVVNGERAKIPPSPEPAAYTVTPGRIRGEAFTGKLCP
jgi:hypothetical protein